MFTWENEISEKNENKKVLCLLQNDTTYIFTILMRGSIFEQKFVHIKDKKI